jgi:hypothetical protein
MSQVITNAFEQYWQSSLAAEQPVVLDEFILADIPNLDITSPIDPATGLPPESQIVHRQNVDQRGRINNNAVAYTIVMDTTVGDFSFNAMYLCNKQNGVIGMIVYKGRETKLKTDQTTGQTGNSLVKSMLMGYDQAAEATLTNVDAGTWQIDYAARLRGQDEDLRQLASQLYGHHTFIGDGFKVVQQDGGHQVTQGVAIVGGLRIELKQPEVIHPGTKPIGVWVDVHRSGSLLSEHQNHFTIITSVADLTDHVDESGYPHYVAKLATVQADSTVIDGRGQGGSGGSGVIPDTFALWKRSMAEAGYDLIGQFGTANNIETTDQVLLNKDGTKVYAWLGELPKAVEINEDPSTPGWVARSGDLLRHAIGMWSGAGLVGFSYTETYKTGSAGKRLQYIVCANDAPFNADPTFTTDSSDAVINAIQWALDNGASVVWLRAGRYKMTKDFIIPPGITLLGDGIDYWDAYRPDPERLLKAWDKGTHLVFTGTGTKNKTCLNLHNARPTKTVGGVPYPFTDFTNNDSVGGAPATAKPFSVAVTVQRGAQLKNLRVMVSKNGIDGYNDAASLTLGDDWDVGVWVYDSSDAVVDNVQSVGYWRMAGWLVTENDGSYTLKGNPERTKFHKLLGQGRRGIIQRNSPQIDVVSNTTTTVTCKYNSSWTLTAQNQFTISGSSSKYTFTGYSVAGNEITLTGVTPTLPAELGVIRAPNQGNNFSGSVFTDCVFCALDHTSGTKSADLGIGEAGAFEIDGYPMRNLKFINTKFQTVFDRLNGIWGDCRDVKLIGCEHENGVVIAYDLTETQGYTGNIRYSCSDLQDTCDLTSFTPRDMFNDYRQFPTRFTDGSFIIKNWRETPISIKWFNGAKGLHLDEVNNRLDLRDKQDIQRFRAFGDGGNDYLGANHAFKDLAGVAAFTIFAASKNASFGGNASPSTANNGSLGTVSTPWANGAMQTAMTITSDEITKTRPFVITEAMLDAWGEVDWVSYQIISRIIEKGDDKARWHVGVIAQRVKEAFARHGLNAHDYAFFCFDKWEYQHAITQDHPAEFNDDGECIQEAWTEVVKPELQAGELYSIRYEEALALEAALQRRNYQHLLTRIAELEAS